MQHQTPPPRGEAERLRELFSLKLLDTQQEERFHRYAWLASDMLDVPSAFISLVGRDKLWFKGTVGFSLGEITRSASFCTHAVAADALLLVEDARDDPRFADNPLVRGAPGMRFYAGQPIHGPSGQPLGALCVFDMTPRKLREGDELRLSQLSELVEHEIRQGYQIDFLREEIERAAYYDPLTHLPNHRLLRDRLDFVIQLAHLQQERVAVAMLDIQGFSAINHNFGVQTGDALLRSVASGLAHLHPEPHIVGRWHNDDFVIIDPALAISPEEFVNDIQTLFDKPFRVYGKKHHLDASLGVAVYPDSGKDSESLLRHAVTAMHASDEIGNTGGEVYRPELEIERSRRLTVATRLRSAIEHSEIALAYQPKLDVSGQQLLGAEALVRWSDAELGPVSPLELISVAERTGLIHSLDEHLLWQACEQAANWEQQGLTVPIAVNLSPGELHQPNLVRRVSNALAVSGLSGDRLYLEVTEGSLIEDIESAVKVMRSLGKLGVRVAIDDFGTGYSSFAYLAELPAACVKIDRCFIAPATTQDAAAKVVRSIIGLAHGLGMSVVAEGVESEAQLRFLREAGCDEIQGFHFSPALMPPEFEAYAKVLQQPPSSEQAAQRNTSH